jgi:hypothetical protein
VDRIGRVRADDDVARAGDRLGEIGEALLGAQGGDHLAGDTDAQVNALNETQSFSGATIFYALAFSNHDNDSDYQPNGISITGDSAVEIGQGATLQADTVDLSALISKLHAAAHAGAESFLVLLIGATTAYAEANISVNTTAQVLIDGAAGAPTSVTGAEGVDLRALTQDVNLTRLASRLAVGLIPPQEASAGGSPIQPSSGEDARFWTGWNGNFSCFSITVGDFTPCCRRLSYRFARG